MTWTILALVIAVAIYMFGGMLFGHDPKKPKTLGLRIVKKSVKLAALALLIVGVSRLWTPYYLTSVNPGILREMVNGMQAAEQKNSSSEIKKHVKKHGAEMIKNAPVIGNADAKKTVFVFTDYSCPYCRRVNSELQKVLKDDKDVRVVVKNFSIHGVLSDAPARAMIASKMQGGKCSPEVLNDMLFEKPYWPEDLKQDQSAIEKTVLKNVLALAKKANCDMEKLEADMKSQNVSDEMAQVSELSQKFQISGTPFLIVGEQAFPGAISAEQIKNAL